MNFTKIFTIIFLILLTGLLFLDPWKLVPMAAFFYMWDSLTPELKKEPKND